MEEWTQTLEPRPGQPVPAGPVPVVVTAAPVPERAWGRHRVAGFPHRDRFPEEPTGAGHAPRHPPHEKRRPTERVEHRFDGRVTPPGVPGPAEPDGGGHDLGDGRKVDRIGTAPVERVEGGVELAREEVDVAQPEADGDVDGGSEQNDPAHPPEGRRPPAAVRSPPMHRP